MLSVDIPNPGNVTRLLLDVRDGERGAFEQLFALVYDELHQLARQLLHETHARRTLHARALVHERTRRANCGRCDGAPVDDAGYDAL